MPIRWTVNHAERLVELVLDGDVSIEDATHFFDGLEAANAIPYRKFVDATNSRFFRDAAAARQLLDTRP